LRFPKKRRGNNEGIDKEYVHLARDKMGRICEGLAGGQINSEGIVCI